MQTTPRLGMTLLAANLGRMFKAAPTYILQYRVVADEGLQSV
jgi:hypothetical protein